MSKYTVAQIKNWDVDTETPSGGRIPARPLNPTGVITRCRHALGVLTKRYDVLDWEHEAFAVESKDLPIKEHFQIGVDNGAEEIMVNTPYDVFILPLRPSGLSSGPRFVVHVPGPEQPAAPSGAVNVIGMPEFDELLDHIYEYGTAAEGVIEKANAFARAVIARYAPQQPAEIEALRAEVEDYRTPHLGGGREEVMTPNPMPLNSEKCSYLCPYYMGGPVLSLCRLTNEKLIYDGNIPPKRTERCKQEASND
jgi:hypothetical protein